MLRLAEAHCHPEAWEDGYAALREVANDGDDEEMWVLEGRAAPGDTWPVSGLPDGALFTAAEFGDGSDEEFLRRLWGDLHGGEDVQNSTTVGVRGGEDGAGHRGGIR